MSRREAARALRDTLRELHAATSGASRSANHATGLTLAFRHELVPAAAIVREAATLLLHAAENLTRLASVRRPAQPRKSPRTAKSARRRSSP